MALLSALICCGIFCGHAAALDNVVSAGVNDVLEHPVRAHLMQGAQFQTNHYWS